MNTNTTGRRRYQAGAAAITTIAAVIFGAAAYGTETASDGQQPAAPAAPAPKVQSTPHAPSSADSAERDGKADAKDRRAIHTPGGRDVVFP
jgi:hypothetical protein